MRWLTRRRKRPTPDQVEALRARVHAELQLRKAATEHAAAVNLAQTLREIRKTNHFGLSLERAFGSKP